MARYAYERLSAIDHSFLAMETPHGCMHVASVGIFERGTLRADAGVDFEAIRRTVEARLHLMPRYREKLRWVPLEGHPVWIDDASFNLLYHLRHAALPHPGSERQLKRLSARILSQHLDRSKPLWETCVVEGLEGDRFAMIQKTHHCMIDGVSGVDLLTVLLSPTPRLEPAEPAPPFVPRPEPSPWELLRDETLRRAALPLEGLRDLSAFVREARDLRHELARRGRALAETLGWGLRSASETPINRPIGSHRRFDWLRTSIADIRAVRGALGGSLNDVVLATVAGAVRAFLASRGVRTEELRFRVLAPVSVRSEAERGSLGNRVSGWVLELPIGEPDPRARLADVVRQTKGLKERQQALAGELLARLMEWTPSRLFELAARGGQRLLPFNLVVTNVPGPQTPLHLLGAKMLECYPAVPLADRLGLGIALFSYDGALHWGLNADWEQIPDLHEFVLALEASFRELLAVAQPIVLRATAEPAVRSATA
jgi:WS/DGAT/MGAT family acyltransferase